MEIGHHEEYLKLNFWVLALRQREWFTLIRPDEGLTLETSALHTIFGGQFTLSTQLIKPNYLEISLPSPPTQHNSFSRTP